MKLFHKLKLRYKIGLLPLVSLFGFLSYLLYSLIINVQNEERFTQIGEQDYPVLEIVNENWLVLLEIEANFSEAVLEEDEALLTDAQQQAQQILDSFKRINKINPKLSKDLIPLRSSFEQYFSTANAIATSMIVGEMERDKIQKKLLIMHNQYDQFKLMQGSFKNKIQVSFSEKLQHSKNNASNSNQLGIFIGVMLIILSVAISIFITRLITRPLVHTIEIAKKISNGDWDIEIEDTSGQAADELTQLTDAFGHMKMKLHATISDLVSARNEALMAGKAKAEFLTSMSHEIRTPMNGVLGMLSLLSNTSLDDEQRHRLSVAESSAQYLLLLINDILDFSKVDAGKLELESLDFSLHSLLGEFVEAMGYQAQSKKLELMLDATGVEQSLVKGDPGRLRQILTNLVSNAIKFTSRGEIIIHCDLQSFNDQQWQFICSITDTGIGIPVDKLPHIFDSFSQVDASTTREYGGTGLGLAIVKKLCELMGGGVTATSKMGKGSSFELNVLLQKSAQSQQLVPQVNMQAFKVLVVDDNASNRSILRSQLEHWGASVEVVEDGLQALSVCEEHAQQTDKAFFDMAFIDMQMPDMDGTELGKALKADERFSSMKLVMMTSMESPVDAKYFAELGFSGYFPKPATTLDLFDALSLVAEAGKGQQQSEPLFTSHNLKTLINNEDDALIVSKPVWPNNTRVLLVEDNQVNQMVATAMLNEIGLQSDVAENGKEALQRLQQSPQDALYTMVLMDCQMPEMDGYDASKEIRAGNAGEHNITIPIIAMTANAMAGDREKCLAAGMNDYLSKPVEPDLLMIKLQQWLVGTENKESADK